jgi:hypothetical protein
MFGFTSDSLIPTLLSSLFLDLAQRVIVENFNIDDKLIDVVLNSSPIAARHTSIVHIKLSENGQVQTRKKYVWAHKDMQPWGNPLPPQCERCGAFRPWGPRLRGKDKVTAEFSCQAVTSDGLQCKHVVRFVKPEVEGLQIFKEWMSMNWP